MDENREIKVGDRRYDASGPRRVMAMEDPWLLVRRPGCIPHAMHRTDWLKLSATLVDGTGRQTREGEDGA